MITKEDALMVFVAQNFIHLGEILREISSMTRDSLLYPMEIHELSQKDLKSVWRSPVLIDLERYPGLIAAVRAYMEWLENNQYSPLSVEIGTHINRVQYFLDSLLPENSVYEQRSVLLSRVHVISTLLSDFQLLYSGAVDLVVNVRHHYTKKIESTAEHIEIFGGDTFAEVDVIYKKYSDLMPLLEEKGATRLIEASKASLEISLIHWEQSYWECVYTLGPVTKDIERKLYAYLSSSLFSLVSAHEKLIFVLAIASGYKKSINKLYLGAVMKYFEENQKILYDRIMGSDRRDTVQTARRLRNSSTHRMSSYRLEELRGYIRSLIVEVHCTLDLFWECGDITGVSESK